MPVEALIGIAIGEGVVLIGLIIAIAVILKKNRKPEGKADNVKIENGVRYTTDRVEQTADGEVAITHLKGDVILRRGKTYVVGKGGAVIPGKYTVLSHNENTETFNIRSGGIVREYKHASDIVLADGERICAVSHAVVLR